MVCFYPLFLKTTTTLSGFVIYRSYEILTKTLRLLIYMKDVMHNCPVCELPFPYQCPSCTTDTYRESCVKTTMAQALAKAAEEPKLIDISSGEDVCLQ